MSFERLGLGGVFTFDESDGVRGLARIQDSGRAAQTVMDSLGRSVDQFGRALGGLGLATAPLAALLGLGVKTAAEFEHQMSAVRAITGATAEEMVILENAAKKAGVSSVFTATEAAKAQEELGKQGFTTSEILAALPGVMNAAAAEGMELSRSAEIVAQVLRSMGLAADQAIRVSDVLAATSARSGTSINLLGSSFAYAAPQARTMGINLETTAAALGAISDSGLRGTAAGTSFTNMLVALGKPTKKAQQYMKALGVEIQKNKDGTVNLVETVRTFNSALNTVSDRAQRAAATTEIFGQRGQKAFNALGVALDTIVPETGKNKLDTLIDGLHNVAGAAEEMASKRLDNLIGRLKLLRGVIETFAIETAGMFLKGASANVDILYQSLKRVTELMQLMNSGKLTPDNLMMGVMEHVAAPPKTAANDNGMAETLARALETGAVSETEALQRYGAAAIEAAKRVSTGIASAMAEGEAAMKNSSSGAAALGQQRIDAANDAANSVIDANRRIIESDKSRDKSLDVTQEKVKAAIALFGETEAIQKYGFMAVQAAANTNAAEGALTSFGNHAMEIAKQLKFGDITKDEALQKYGEVAVKAALQIDPSTFSNMEAIERFGTTTIAVTTGIYEGFQLVVKGFHEAHDAALRFFKLFSDSSDKELTHSIAKWVTVGAIVLGVLSPILIALGGIVLFVSSVVVPLFTSLGSLFVAVGAFFTSGLIAPILAGAAVAYAVWSVGSTQIMGLFETLRAFAVEAWDWIKDTAVKTFESFMVVGGPVINWLKGVFTHFVLHALTKLQELWTGFTNFFTFIKPLATFVFQAIGAVASLMFAAIGGMLGGLMKVGEALITLFTTVLTVVIEAVAKGLQLLVQGVVALADAMNMPVSDGLRQFANQEAFKFDRAKMAQETTDDRAALAQATTDQAAATKAQAQKTPTVEATVNLEDKRQLDIHNCMQVDGRELALATGRHKQEISERAGFNSTRWQQRFGHDHGVEPKSAASGG